MRNPLYTAYERQLVKGLPGERLPRHVGLMLDGNRRWAKLRGENTEHGHRAGADNIEPLLTWCDELGIEVVTLWLLSTDNLKRSEVELGPLLEIIEDVVDGLAASGRRLNLVGALGLLPDATRARLQAAVEKTTDAEGLVVNIAVGYGGRQEIVDAFRAMLLDAAERGESLKSLADRLTIENVGDYLADVGLAAALFWTLPPRRGTRPIAAALTLLAVEALEAMAADLGTPPFDPLLTRRNVVLRGAELAPLLGGEFALESQGAFVRLRGGRPAHPCAWMDRVLAPGAHAAMRGRGGLRCQVLSDGFLHRGPAVLHSPVPLEAERAGDSVRRRPTRLP